MRINKDIIFRYMLFIIGLFIASLGVAFSTKAGLGTSPVAALPYTVSLISELFTFGTLSYFYNDLKTADKKDLFIFIAVGSIIRGTTPKIKDIAAITIVFVNVIYKASSPYSISSNFSSE